MSDFLHFYGETFISVMKIPIYTFWEMQKNLDKIRSLEDKRMFICVGNILSENPQKYINQLDSDIGDVIKVKPQLDKKGLSKLKSLF